MGEVAREVLVVDRREGALFALLGVVELIFEPTLGFRAVNDVDD